jgi:hypothetical protein
MFFENRLPHREHIPPHRVWTYLSGEVDLTVPEHVHIMGCPWCHEVFNACLQSETFGAALMMLEHKESA